MMQKFLFIMVLALSGCSLLSPHNRLIRQNSHNKESYQGIDHVATFESTFLSAEVHESILKMKSTWYKYDAPTEADKRRLYQVLIQEKTHFMLSAYTSKFELDDFGKTKSLWKIYLNVDEKRYEGRVTKSTMPPVMIKKLFPYYNSFGSVYKVSFSVPTQKVTSASSTSFLITGPLGHYLHKIK